MLDAVYSRYGEEVNIFVTMFEEILHLSGSPLDTELLGIFVSFTFQYLLCEFFRNIAVEGFRHYCELAQLGERLDGRNDRNGYAYLPSLFNESIELLVVVEELGNGIRCAQLLFLQQMLHIHFEVELQQVLPSLPDQHSNKEGNYYGRITQPVVNFLLAKLALNAEIYMYDDWTQGYASRPKGSDIHFSVPASDASLRNGDKVDCRKLNAWETCIYYCDKLAEEGYDLESDDSFNFSTHNETSKENIFTIPMDKNIYTNQFHYLFRSYHYTHGGVLGWGSENGTCATISTMKANHYGEADEDVRCKMNFVAGVVKVDGHELLMDNGKPLEYQPFEVAQNLTNSKFVKTAGARMAKYEVDRTSYMDGKLQSNDIVLFRYADVLLMKAEAKVRLGENGDEELNRIRARVGMPYRKATLDNILEERLLELVWEGWRRQDLIRFGKFTGAYDLRTPLQGESSGYTTVFPIPQKCIDLNSELVQNKGYVNILK